MLDPGALAALTPYLLVFGAFTLPLFKVFKISRSIVRVYGFLYVLASLIMSFLIHMNTLNGQVHVYLMAGFPPPIGITYTVDSFNGFLALLVAVLFILMYPLMRRYVDDNEYFYAMLLALEAGMIGVLYTGDIFNMFVMIELMLIATYSLIASYEKPRSFKGAFKYAMIAGVSGMIFFLAAVLYYNVLGTLNIGHGGAIVEKLVQPLGKSSNPLTALNIVLLIMLWAILVKTALVPLHFWLPDAYSSAPPPIASLLAGLSEGIGFYILIRIYHTLLGGFDWPVALLIGVLGTASILVGGFGMIFSNDILKIISYSVVLDAGYIAVALSMGVTGVYIALSYIIAHAIVKPLLFMTTGYVVHERGEYDLDKLRGVMRSNPVIQAGFLVGAVSVVGVPPTLLFQAKLQLYIEVFNNISTWNVYAIVALIAMAMGSVMALTGFSRILYSTIFMYGEPVRKPDSYLKALTLALALAAVFLGIVYGYLYQSLIVPMGSSATVNRINYIQAVTTRLGWLKW